MRLFLIITVLFFAIHCKNNSQSQEVPQNPSSRNPLNQPFHHTSIWNMPIGSAAEYVHAKIQKATAYGMTVDEDIIVTWLLTS